MSNDERITKTTISISLPKSFYDFYMKHHLWEEFSSFSDWVRHAVRKDRELQKAQKVLSGTSDFRELSQ